MIIKAGWLYAFCTHIYTKTDEETTQNVLEYSFKPYLERLDNSKKSLLNPRAYDYSALFEAITAF